MWRLPYSPEQLRESDCCHPKPGIEKRESPVRAIGTGARGHLLRSGPLTLDSIREGSSVIAIGNVTYIDKQITLAHHRPFPPITGNVVTFDVVEPLSEYKSSTMTVVVAEEMVPLTVGRKYIVSASYGGLLQLTERVYRPLWIAPYASGELTDADHEFTTTDEAIRRVARDLTHAESVDHRPTTFGIDGSSPSDLAPRDYVA